MRMEYNGDFAFICELSHEDFVMLAEFLQAFSDWYDHFYAPYVYGAVHEEPLALYRFINRSEDGKGGTKNDC